MPRQRGRPEPPAPASRRPARIRWRALARGRQQARAGHGPRAALSGRHAGPPTLAPAGGPVLVSACLAGLRCRYDGRSRPSASCMAALEGRAWIPFCPEQLGGLPTPRVPADLAGGDGHAVLAGRARVLRKDGRDVSAAFVRGAREALALARVTGATEAWLKARSPSCGLGPPGVCAALFMLQGIRLREF